MGQSEVQKTLQQIVSRLEELKIPHAVVGGMALVAHGYKRTTDDVDILVTLDGLRRVHEALDGLGYLPPFTGSKHLRNTTTNVRVEFLVSGGFPGDGKPKPVAFPTPDDNVIVTIDGVRYLGLPQLIELKLASGMTGGPGRLKDLADVVEVAKAIGLTPAFADQLHPYVREKFVELTRGLHDDVVDHGSVPEAP